VSCSGALNAEALPRDVVLLGASAGGVDAIGELLTRLPGTLSAAIAVAIHLSPFHESGLAPTWSRQASLPVDWATDEAPFQPGHVYVAVPDHHLTIHNGRMRLTRDARQHFTRPAIDPLFESGAKAHRDRVVGVLLSGSGADGVRGLNAIDAAGGLVLVQDPRQAAFPAMPRAAIVGNGVDAVLSLQEIAEVLPRLARGDVIDLRRGATTAGI
jgi:two-component system chemotaxis response regulator CheB